MKLLTLLSLILLDVADVAADNLNVNKTVLTRGVSILFINGRPAVINGLRKMRNPPSGLVFLNKILLFSKDVITFTISLAALFIRVIPEPSLKIKLYFFVAISTNSSAAFLNAFTRT